MLEDDAARLPAMSNECVRAMTLPTSTVWRHESAEETSPIDLAVEPCCGVATEGCTQKMLNRACT